MLDHASLAYHAQGADRHDEVPAIARRGAARYLEKGLTFSALRLAAEGLAEAPNDPELLAVATEAAWRLDFLSRGADDRGALGEGGRRAARPDRRPALRRPPAPRARRRVGVAGPASASWRRCGRALDDRRLRGVAAWSLAQLHMIGGRDVEAVAWADEALVDARSRRRRAHRGAGARRAGRGVAGRAAAAGVARRASTTPSPRPGAAATPCCSTRAINNGLDLLPSHSAEAAALRAEMQAVSSGIGFDKLGTAATLAWELEAAYSAGDLPMLRRVAAEGSQWWGRPSPHHAWISSVARRLRPRGGPHRRRRRGPRRVRRRRARTTSASTSSGSTIALAAARGDRARGRPAVRGPAAAAASCSTRRSR